MKTLIAGLLAVTLLGGCVAVPYYAEPAPAPGYYYYGPAHPPATFSFRYDYHSGPRHHH